MFYRGMVWLLPLVSSNVIVTCLVPSPPCGVGGLWSFWLAPPSLCGAVCSTEIWYGCCHLLVVMSSLRARYHTKYDVALFSLQTVRPVPALMRFSAPVKKHWLGSFSIVLPRSGLRGFVPVVRREQGPPAAGGRGQGRGGGYHGGGGGVWGPGTREHIYIYIHFLFILVVGSLSKGPHNKAPLIFENSLMYILYIHRHGPTREIPQQ